MCCRWWGAHYSFASSVTAALLRRTLWQTLPRVPSGLTSALPTLRMRRIPAAGWIPRSTVIACRFLIREARHGSRACHRSGSDVFKDLRAILRDEEPAGGGYQQHLQMDWSTFDFAHVPVGLLSQVYEGFVWKWAPDEAGVTSVHYTPRLIADYLVDDAFDGLRRAGKARILDPACGAGVFLVLAFRRLYRERWKATGERPERPTIREILNKQLRGFDISESALRLAALSLYLTAIGLDPKPTPPAALRFKNLRDRVLFNCRSSEDASNGPVAGSLDAKMLEGRRGKYQLVIGNPPWTSLDKSQRQLAATFHDIGRGF